MSVILSNGEGIIVQIGETGEIFEYSTMSLEDLQRALGMTPTRQENDEA